MKATEFEFRFRFYIVAAIFWFAFSCSWLDHQRAGKSVALLFGFHDQLAMQVVYGIGALVVILGASVRTWAALYLRSDIVHDTALHSEQLVADGPYRYVRNPLYLGVLLLSIGMGLMASRLGWVVLVVCNLWFYTRLAFREEAALSATQGESYQAYLRAVPRIIPSLTPRLPSSGSQPQWGQALIGESFMWAFAFATVLFAITLNGSLTWTLTFIILAGYFVGQMVLRRRKTRLPSHS